MTTRQAPSTSSTATPGNGSQRMPAAAPDGLPRSVRIAAIVQLVEAVGIMVAALIAGVDAITGKSYQLASGIAITVIGIATALALAYVARGLSSGRRWSRTPAMLTQLFTGIVGIYLVQAPRLDWGIPAVALAICGFGALLAPGSVRVLTPGRTKQP
ncbi:MAG TPA: hypothetical protein VMA32_15885 [Streptosporangiaceae bacterium]|nr:hypothetical protein [Streptosporangiaceae bacterium]